VCSRMISHVVASAMTLYTELPTTWGKQCVGRPVAVVAAQGDVAARGGEEAVNLA
jgi:hypothetical protein